MSNQSSIAREMYIFSVRTVRFSITTHKVITSVVNYLNMEANMP